MVIIDLPMQHIAALVRHEHDDHHEPPRTTDSDAMTMKRSATPAPAGAEWGVGGAQHAGVLLV